MPAGIDKLLPHAQPAMPGTHALSCPLFLVVVCAPTGYASRLYAYLQQVENRIFSEGLHVLGAPPSRAQMESYLSAYFGPDLPAEAVSAVAELGDLGVEEVKRRLERAWRLGSAAGAAAAAASGSAATAAGGGSSGTAGTMAPAAAQGGGAGSCTQGQGAGGGQRTGEEGWEARLGEAVQIQQLLMRNGEELDGVMRALGGEYILPEAGGDLLRDGPGECKEPPGRPACLFNCLRRPPGSLKRMHALWRTNTHNQAHSRTNTPTQSDIHAQMHARTHLDWFTTVNVRRLRWHCCSACC